MKISSKKEFHSYVSSLQSLLLEENVPIKTSKVAELLAKTLGYNSANGLYSKLPICHTLELVNFTKFTNRLIEHHNVYSINAAILLNLLETQHESYSTAWESDHKCYPKQLTKNENYWYLTCEGWLPWQRMDFSKMKVELNIFKVVHSSTHAMGGSARPIWDSSIASPEFEKESVKLEKKFGDMPDSKTLLSISY
jgi:hypothetical protein